MDLQNQFADLLQHKPPPCDLNQFYGIDYNLQIAISLADHINIPFGVYKQKLRSAKLYWTKEQDSALQIALQDHPENWKFAAQEVSKLGEKNSQQCQQRWRRVLMPKLVKGRWSTEEDSELLTLLNIHGTNYLKIDSLMPTRSYVQIRNRIQKLKGKK
ncbi:Myb-like DNA-binding domain-containing protein [Spironucleus salmonicida]|uniref:Myb-like DNA-binding domain-containing protein n=1 Tax=Spironucleus salmonicida TaxID=348837 RepID=V6LTQ9_9EUKA|nr:Myb-like DNA-binding domain-containing protein [Spironucleus salmonicida]|eukprot:EST47633.1 Myb-like DNA-binding domain-containing protein [Spironucleus salmonicida]